MRVRVQVGREAGQQGLRGPFTLSLVLHSALFSLAFVSFSQSVTWGEPGGGGSAVPVNLVAGIPLPASQGPPNPLATDTKTVNPPEVATKKVEEVTPPQPSAKELEMEERRQTKQLAQLERERLRRELAQLQESAANAIPGQGSRASSELFGRFPTAQGSGGIGFGGDFGGRYGWYVRTVRECITRHWDRSRVDTSIRSAPKVFLEFQIARDGTIVQERVTTSSGIPSVDREALRAVQACSGRGDVGADAHLPPLPTDYSGSSVKVEVWFEFRQ